MYVCQGCNGEFRFFKTAGQCPICGLWASVRCAECGHTDEAESFINEGNSCPECGAAASIDGSLVNVKCPACGHTGEAKNFIDKENCCPECGAAVSIPGADGTVFGIIRSALADALGVEEEEVTPEATLVSDLGAESIDFLDIVFRLEKGFDIKIPRGELFPEDVFTDSRYVQDGRVTEEGLEELRRRMPFVNLDEFAENPLVQNFANLLTVADMCRFVESKVGVTD